MKIALLGKVPKGDDARKEFAEWYQEYADKISEYIPDAEFLHGDGIRDTAGSMNVVGHDLWLVKHADVVVVDARTKIGAGTAQEMVIAKYFKRPVVAVVPKDTHHRRSNVAFDGEVIADWVHPFIEVSSDHIAETIDDAAVWIKRLPEEAQRYIKDISIFDRAVAKFEEGLADTANQYRARGW